MAVKSEQAKAHRREYQKRYRAEHKKEIAERAKKYREAHKETLQANWKKWHAANKEYRKEYNKEWLNDNPDKAREYRKRDYEKYGERRKAAVLKYEKENPEKIRKRNDRWNKKTGNASHKVHWAIESGRLSPSPCCVCGATPAEAHHCDYNRPLDVMWLCKKCHTNWHKHNEPIYFNENYVPAGRE